MRTSDGHCIGYELRKRKTRKQGSKETSTSRGLIVVEPLDLHSSLVPRVEIAVELKCRCGEVASGSPSNPSPLYRMLRT